MNRRIAIAAATALLLIGGAAFWPTPKPDSLTALGAAGAQEGEVDTSTIREMTLGDPDAAVEVIEYASFTCPHCRNFHANVFDRLKADYIDTGKIHYIYREVYFDRFGLWAAMVARCGDLPHEDAEAEPTPAEKRYFGIADMLYEQQPEWTAAETPAGIADNLRRIGRTAGLTDDALQACLTDAETAQAMVTLYQENAEADGITSTPSFVIDGTKYSNMNYADFSALLDEKLAE